MTIPLGIYLRYYFKCSLKKTLLLGFCASFFFEATQYSALFGIYPKPYRYTEVDDLINNTMGALIGFVIEPLFAKLLPTREEIDRISYKKGEEVTFVRRFFAVLIDYALFNLIFALTEAFFIPRNGVDILTTITVWFIEAFIYIVIVPVVLKARTPGQAMLKLKLVREDGSEVSGGTTIKRNILLYVVEYLLLNISGYLLTVFVMILQDWKTYSQWLILVTGAVCVLIVTLALSFILGCLRKYNMMPHSHFSHTIEVKY